MGSQLHRRIRRIEAEVTGPERTVSSVVLEAPAEGAAAHLWEQHKRDLVEARKRYAQVIVISDQHSRRQATGPGLVFVPNRFEACLAVAASRPSGRGNKSLLDDLLLGLGGNVVGIVAC